MAQQYKSLISLTVFLVILGTEVFYKETLYSYTLDYTPSIQANSSKLEQTAWLIYSDFGLIASIAVPIFY